MARQWNTRTLDRWNICARDDGCRCAVRARLRGPGESPAGRSLRLAEAPRRLAGASSSCAPPPGFGGRVCPAAAPGAGDGAPRRVRRGRHSGRAPVGCRVGLGPVAHDEDSGAAGVRRRSRLAGLRQPWRRTMMQHQPPLEPSAPAIPQPLFRSAARHIGDQAAVGCVPLEPGVEFAERGLGRSDGRRTVVGMMVTRMVLAGLPTVAAGCEPIAQCVRARRGEAKSSLDRTASRASRPIRRIIEAAR